MSLFKSASTVSLLTLASRITGLVRELLMASVFGVSALTDAFNVAFRIPNLFRRVLGEGAFSQAFVPVLAATRAAEGDEGAKDLINHVATLLAWTLVLLCIAGVLGAPLMVWAMASGLRQTPEGFDAAVIMTRIMFPYIGFMSMVALAGGILNTWKKFAVPAASPVLLNVSLIASIIWGAPWFARQGIEPIYAQCVGVMVGGMLQLGIQIRALRRLGLVPRIGARWAAIRAAWANPTTRKVAKLMLPALVGVSVAQISLLINTQIASHLAIGSVSWITYADRLMELPTALLGVALGVVLMPQLAAARAVHDDARYSALLDWGLRLVVVFSVPCMVALLVFAKPLVAVLYHYGAFTVLDVQRTTLALTGYGVGIVGIVAIKILASAVRDFSSIDWASMGKGLAGVSATLLALGIFSKLASANKVGLAQSAGLVLLAGALKILATVVGDFSDMSWGELGKGMAGMAAALALVAGAMALLPPTMIISA